MSEPGRRKKAAGLLRAFMCSAILLEKQEQEIRAEHKQQYEDIRAGTDFRGKNPRFTREEELAQVDWLEKHYPHIALTLDVGAYAIHLIGLKGLWKECGFSSEDEWLLAADDEEYLRRLRIELNL